MSFFFKGEKLSCGTWKGETIMGETGRWERSVVCAFYLEARWDTEVKQVTQQVTGIRIHVSWLPAQNLIWSKIWLDSILLSLEFYRL